jgi:hypothetical protein
MWNTSEGERVFRGAEATLFLRAFFHLVDEVETAIQEPCDLDSGVARFDALSREQQFVLLVEVGAALLCPEVAIPELTAVNEAAVAAVYARLRDFVGDIDVAAACGDLDAIAAAAEEAGLEVPSIHAPLDRGDWECLIDELSDLVLWDDDWKYDFGIPDAAPERAAVFHEHVGVARDYWTAIAPDPSPAQLRHAKGVLRELVAAFRYGT